MKSLAISVGHNASVVLIDDGEIIAGYEEERFTRKKADSTFPRNAILELKKRYDLPPKTDAYISHWFPNGRLEKESKYWSCKEYVELFPTANMYSLNGLTHHDAHMEGARVFAGHDFPRNHHVFVMDGFGTAGEYITVYECHAFSQPRIVLKFSGYMFSLGLFYQYATAYCGMQMHNHEYKMLAYETHIQEVRGIDLAAYMMAIDEFSFNAVKMMKLKNKRELDLDGLAKTKEFVMATLDLFLLQFGPADISEYERRVMTSYFAQRHIENIVMSVFAAVKPTNLIVAGGLFYNVKVNGILATLVPGKFCAMPLAGDQGTGIGVYQFFNGDLRWPGHLFWGHRSIDSKSLLNYPGIVRTTCNDETYETIYNGLKKYDFVNLVRGSMEFGPRALCNTSTLAIPTIENAEKINFMNNRTNEMPFALVMSYKDADWHFEHIEKIHNSLKYMVVTRKFRKGRHKNLVAGAHHYPIMDYWTCRPQVNGWDGILIDQLLQDFGPLINTSWNYHGVPIVRSTKDILFTHNMERERAGDTFITIIEDNDERLR